MHSKTQKHGKCIYSLECCITALPDFNWQLIDLFNVVNQQWLPKSRKLWAAGGGGAQLRRNEVESFMLPQLDCVELRVRT